MRRKERSGPVITNSDEAATCPSCGDEVAAASDGLETAAAAKSLALAGKQQLQKTEATTRMEKPRGDFMAGFLSEPARSHATGRSVAESGDCHSSAKPSHAHSRACYSWPLFSNSN